MASSTPDQRIVLVRIQRRVLDINKENIDIYIKILGILDEMYSYRWLWIYWKSFG